MGIRLLLRLQIMATKKKNKNPEGRIKRMSEAAVLREQTFWLL